MRIVCNHNSSPVSAFHQEVSNLPESWWFRKARFLLQAGGRLFLHLALLLTLAGSWGIQARADEPDEDPIEIIEGKDQTIYEYRQNGVLTMIKVVPKFGRPYYMVPADGAAHFETLEHKRRLHPQWTILEF